MANVDFAGARLEGPANGTVTYYRYNEVTGALQAELDSSGTVTASYVTGPGGSPISVTRGGKTYFYHTNAHGDVTFITDAGGNPLASFTYDAWGVPTELTAAGQSVPIGTWAGSPGEGLFFLSGGMLYDAATGLYLTKSRVYDPKTGRFLSRDILDETGKNGVYKGFPFGKDAIGTNLYAWCGNSPVTKVDPSGQDGLWDDICGVADYVGGAIKGVANDAWNLAGDGLDWLGGEIDRLGGEINSGLDWLGGKVSNLAGDIGSAAKAAGRDIWSGASSAISYAESKAEAAAQAARVYAAKKAQAAVDLQKKVLAGYGVSSSLAKNTKDELDPSKNIVNCTDTGGQILGFQFGFNTSSDNSLESTPYVGLSTPGFDLHQEYSHSQCSNSGAYENIGYSIGVGEGTISIGNEGPPSVEAGPSFGVPGPSASATFVLPLHIPSPRFY